MKRIEVFAQVTECTACDLYAQCIGPVPFRGDSSLIAVVGEAPGEQEDEQGKPFVGPSGELVEKLFESVGLPSLLGVGIVNTVSCFPHRKPTWDEVHACAQNKWDQLAFLQPKYVLLLGDVALKGMRPDLGLKRGRGRPFLVRDYICFASYHPAAGLRNGTYLDGLADDLATFKALIDADDWMTFVPGTCAACPIEAEWFEDCGLGWCRVHLPSEHVAAYEAHHAALAVDHDAARRRSMAQRNDALVQVEAAADPDWMAEAWDALVLWLQTHSEFFCDDIWETGLSEPREARALGPVILRASRENLMEKSGEYRKSIRSNMSAKAVWTSHIFQHGHQ